MPANQRARHWMKIETRVIPASREFTFRRPTIEDVGALGTLMDLSYRGTIDHEGESHEQCIDEMQATLSGKYGPFLDFTSFLITGSDQVLSASLLTLWKGQPLLAFSMSSPQVQGQGYARFLIERSITALAEKNYPGLYLVVTQGNAPAEHLYRSMGFSLTAPLK